MNNQYLEFAILCYLDSKSINNIIALLNPKEFAYIKHDSDYNENGELEKAHYHIYLRFDSYKYLPKLSKLFNVADNLIEPIHNRIMFFRYLIHLDNDEKFQYNFDNIVTNIINLKELMFNLDYNDYCLKFIIGSLNSHFFKSFSSFIKFLVENNMTDFVLKHSYLLKCLYNDK